MYICNFGEDSVFEGLLGFDFIRKFILVIVHDIKCYKINNEYVSFTNKQSDSPIMAIQCEPNETTNHHSVETH